MSGSINTPLSFVLPPGTARTCVGIGLIACFSVLVFVGLVVIVVLTLAGSPG